MKFLALWIVSLAKANSDGTNARGTDYCKRPMKETLVSVVPRELDIPRNVHICIGAEANVIAQISPPKMASLTIS